MGFQDDVRAATDARRERLQEALAALVRIPSVSAPDHDAEQVRRSAEATAALLEEARFEDVHLMEIDRSHPAVFGERPGPEGSPTVLLYAHHDVQPPGPDEQWTTPPFEPTVRGGRMYGRGTSDDKCGICLHVGAVDALDEVLAGVLPVGVKVFVEGEEEIGSLHLADFLRVHGDRLAADAIVIADSGNWRVGVPALTTSLRGLVDATVEVRTLRHAVHSGMFGGPIPDALTVLGRLIATLHDDRGNVAIEGLVARDIDPLDLTEDELRTQAGVLPGVELIGEGSLTSRLWTRPALSVLAIDAPAVSEAINQLVPVARAKVSLRIAPGDDPRRAMDLLVRHLEDRTPWGAQVTVTPGAMGEPFALDTEGPAYDAFRHGMRAAWGREPVEMGVGGSIPFVAAFAEAYPDASILLTGVGDPTSRPHGPDESLDLDEFHRGTFAEALALAAFGGRTD